MICSLFRDSRRVGVIVFLDVHALVQVKVHAFLVVLRAAVVVLLFFGLALNLGSLLSDEVLIELAAIATDLGGSLHKLEHAAALLDLLRDRQRNIIEALNAVLLVERDDLGLVLRRNDHLEHNLEALVELLRLGGLQRLLDGVDTIESETRQLEDGTQLDRLGSELLLDVEKESLLVLVADGDLAEDEVGVREAQLERIVRMIEVIIEIPAPLFIKIEDLGLEGVRRESHDEMHNLGLLEEVLLNLDICHLHISLAEIDIGLGVVLLVKSLHSHDVLSAHTQMLSDVLDTLGTNSRSQNETFDAVVLEEAHVGTLLVDGLDFDNDEVADTGPLVSVETRLQVVSAELCIGVRLRAEFGFFLGDGLLAHLHSNLLRWFHIIIRVFYYF